MKQSQGLGVLMLDVQGLELTAEDREVLANPQVGGVILGLFGRNFASIPQLQELVQAIRECNPGLLLAVDQEGGRVQRFKQDFTRLPPMHVFGQLYEHDPAQARAGAEVCGWLMAAEVLSCGLDISFAPVLDLYLADSRIIADRAFAAKPEVVVELGRAFIRGMHEAGMKATAKHFPGHGSVVEDSHVELPTDHRALARILETDLLPFEVLVDDYDAVMPGHVRYPEVDRHCAAMSETWLQDILRKRLGFSGVIFSDDLTMAAAESAGSVLQRAQLALAAGCDMILVCNNRAEARNVLDWLESCDYPMSKKLAAMQAAHRQQRADLLASDRWCRSVELISNLATHLEIG